VTGDPDYGRVPAGCQHASGITQPLNSLYPTMILSTLAPLLLLPFAAAADGVHRLKLKKLPPTSSNPDLESAYLAEKYGVAQSQTPLMGSGGSGRKVRLGRPGQDEDELFWTQELLTKGGHGVPLSST
jgi:saccharopepsin